MSTFLILESDQDAVLQWCEDNMPPVFAVHRYQWFPFYTLRGQSAFRLSILHPEDALIFALTWHEAEKA